MRKHIVLMKYIIRLKATWYEPVEVSVFRNEILREVKKIIALMNAT